MAKHNYNDMLLFNRPQWPITMDPPEQLSQQNLPYDQFGVLPNVAQNVQDFPYQNNPTPPSYFTEQMRAVTNWFTTRVHLQSIGKAE